MRALTGIGLVLAAFGASTYAQSADSEIERIEAEIAGASEFEIFQKLGDIPPDVIDAFRLTVLWDRMAEWGEPWNTGDVIREGDQHRQHVFSAVSPTVAVVVFRTGGWVVSTRIAVAERSTPGLCEYNGGERIPDSISEVRAFIADSPDAGWLCKYRPQ